MVGGKEMFESRSGLTGFEESLALKLAKEAYGKREETSSVEKVTSFAKENPTETTGIVFGAIGLAGAAYMLGKGRCPAALSESASLAISSKAETSLISNKSLLSEAASRFHVKPVNYSDCIEQVAPYTARRLGYLNPSEDLSKISSFSKLAQIIKPVKGETKPQALETILDATVSSIKSMELARIPLQDLVSTKTASYTVNNFAKMSGFSPINEQSALKIAANGTFQNNSFSSFLGRIIDKLR